MTGTENDKDLDAFFDAARNDPRSAPTPELLARILSDADTVMIGVGTAQRTRGARSGVGRSLIRALGGWPSLGGLAAATLAGVWIGLSAETLIPGGLDTVLPWQTDPDLSDFTTDFTADVAFDATEGL